MKIFCFVSLILGPLIFAQNMDIIRSNYLKSTNDKTICKEMIASLSTSKDPLKLAYLGAYQTIWANHVFSPLSKLKTFNEGKNNIEKSIKLDPKNVETRILRLTIQTKAPKFLGYNEKVEEDQLFVKTNKAMITNLEVKDIYQKLLK